MSITATHTGTLRIVETVTLAGPSTSSVVVDNNAYGKTATLNATSSPVATAGWAGQIALVSGAKTIDLTALPDTNSYLANKTLLGLKIQSMLIEAPADNAAAVVMVVGGTNGYALLGAEDWKLAVEPGQSFLFYFNNTAPAVASGDKTIDCTGTGTDKLNIAIAAGA